MARYIPTNFAPRLYDDWYLLIEDLTPEKQAEVIRAIFKFPDYTPTDVPVWKFIASRLQDQYDRFLANKKIRTEAAKKGAQARWGDTTTNSKKESVKKNPFLTLTKNPEIIAALNNPDSGLSIFLDSGQGYDDALSRLEREFVDRGDVRALCPWAKELQKKPAAPTAAKKIFTPPTLEQWLEYCETLNLDLEKMKSAWQSYHDADWHDSQGNPVKNWKMKISQVWATKPSNKKRADFGRDNSKSDTGASAMIRGAAAAEKMLKARGII